MTRGIQRKLAWVSLLALSTSLAYALNTGATGALSADSRAAHDGLQSTLYVPNVVAIQSAPVTRAIHAHSIPTVYCMLARTGGCQAGGVLVASPRPIQGPLHLLRWHVTRVASSP